MEKIKKLMDETGLSEDDILVMLYMATQRGIQLCLEEYRFDLAVESMRLSDAIKALRYEK